MLRSPAPIRVLNLGVTFDQHLPRMLTTLYSAAPVLCRLNHSRHYLPRSTLLTLVQGLVISRIIYCLVVYGVCNSTQIKRIQKVLNFAARVISGRKKFDHIADVLNDLNWLNAEHLYLYHGLSTLKRILVTTEPVLLAGELPWVMFISGPRGTPITSSHL